jgi:hypothetical protein
VALIPHPVVGKKRSADICATFIAGAPADAEGHVFFGVDFSNSVIWQKIKKAGEPWWFIDNSYFDKTRGTHFRVTRNGLQHTGAGDTDGFRFAALGIDIKPWRKGGAFTVVCPQSPMFMLLVAEDLKWIKRAMQHTQPPIRMRDWTSDKLSAQRSLAADLRDAKMLVTHSSSAAVEAVLAGVPAFCSERSPAHWVTENTDRLRWAGVLADNQFTLKEFEAGTAWQMLNR